MASGSIPVDLRNPGQVFGSIGLAEIAETILSVECESQFAWLPGTSQASFTLYCEGPKNPIATVIEFLCSASVSVVMPRGSRTAFDGLSVAMWRLEEVAADDSIFPSPIPKAPAKLPARLSSGQKAIDLNHWADSSAVGRDNVKFWAGSRGYPGAALARDMVEMLPDGKNVTMSALVEDPFEFTHQMTGSFRFDWRRDYVPLDAGFSPNNHGNISMVGYPLTEILAVAGLQNARPSRVDRRDKLRYRYGVSSARLPTLFARAVLGAVDIGFPMRTFHIQLGWPGQADQARCILDAREEPKS